MSKVDAVIFDLDGTLTQPILDFDRIRKEIGIETGPVWEAIVRMSPDQRQRAEEILLRHEMEAAEICILQPNVLDMLRQLEDRSTHLAVLTRNCRAAWEMVRRRFDINIERVYAREDGPMKPDPTAVLQLVQAMRVVPSRTLMVGDYLFDIQAGKSAGTLTALLINHGTAPDYADQADYLIRDLMEIISIVDRID